MHTYYTLNVLFQVGCVSNLLTPAHFKSEWHIDYFTLKASQTGWTNKHCSSNNMAVTDCITEKKTGDLFCFYAPVWGHCSGLLLSVTASASTLVWWPLFQITFPYNVHGLQRANPRGLLTLQYLCTCLGSRWPSRCRNDPRTMSPWLTTREET